METLTHLKLWRAVGWAMILVVCIASLVPGLPEIPGKLGDKYEHFIAYGALTWWWCMIHPQNARRWALCAGFIVLGIALEFAQLATGYRVCDVMDMVANGMGAVLGRLVVATPLGRVLATVDRLAAQPRGTF